MHFINVICVLALCRRMIPLRADVALISQFIDKHSDECNSTLRQADQVNRKSSCLDCVLNWILSLIKYEAYLKCYCYKRERVLICKLYPR